MWRGGGALRRGGGGGCGVDGWKEAREFREGKLPGNEGSRRGRPGEFGQARSVPPRSRRSWPEHRRGSAERRRRGWPERRRRWPGNGWREPWENELDMGTVGWIIFICAGSTFAKLHAALPQGSHSCKIRMSLLYKVIYLLFFKKNCCI